MHFFLCIALTPLVLFFPETYPPTILSNRAKKLRKEGNPNARASHEISGMTTRQIVRGHVLRPLGTVLLGSISPVLKLMSTVSHDRQRADRPGIRSMGLSRVWYHLVSIFLYDRCNYLSNTSQFLLPSVPRSVYPTSKLI